MKKISHFGPLIFIAVAADIKYDEDPSPLHEHYNVADMLPALKEKFSKTITVDLLEKCILKQSPLGTKERRRLNKIACKKEFLQLKIEELRKIYNSADEIAQHYILKLVAKLLFANKAWVEQHEAYAKSLFRIDEFNEHFFDSRKKVLEYFINN